MNTITIPRLRHNQLQALGEKTLQICKDLTELATEMVKIKTLLEAFKQGMRKNKVTATEKYALDNNRDRILAGLIHSVKAEAIYPYEDEAVENTSKELLRIVAKYGSKIKSLPLQEETVAIDNLLADVKELDLTFFESPAVTRWVPLLEKTNNDFKATAGEYVEDRVEAARTKSASSLAPALVDALEELYALMSAHLKLSANGEMEKAYGEIREVMNSFK